MSSLSLVRSFRLSYMSALMVYVAAVAAESCVMFAA